MQQVFDITQTSRKILAQYLDNYTLAQLNKVPAGFNNNLIWNIAHIIVVQQMLVYNLSGLPMMVSPEMVEKYKRGTKPQADVTQQEIDEIKRLLFETIAHTKSDFEQNRFATTAYNTFTTQMGFTLKTAAEAMQFNYYHEAMHVGMMMGIRKFV